MELIYRVKQCLKVARSIAAEFFILSKVQVPFLVLSALVHQLFLFKNKIAASDDNFIYDEVLSSLGRGV